MLKYLLFVGSQNLLYLEQMACIQLKIISHFVSEHRVCVMQLFDAKDLMCFCCTDRSCCSTKIRGEMMKHYKSFVGVCTVMLPLLDLYFLRTDVLYRG